LVNRNTEPARPIFQNCASRELRQISAAPPASLRSTLGAATPILRRRENPPAPAMTNTATNGGSGTPSVFLRFFRYFAIQSIPALPIASTVMTGYFCNSCFNSFQVRHGDSASLFALQERIGCTRFLTPDLLVAPDVTDRARDTSRPLDAPLAPIRRTSTIRARKTALRVDSIS
jgi:hypothetical protein